MADPGRTNLDVVRQRDAAAVVETFLQNAEAKPGDLSEDSSEKQASAEKRADTAKEADEKEPEE